MAKSSKVARGSGCGVRRVPPTAPRGRAPSAATKKPAPASRAGSSAGGAAEGRLDPAALVGLRGDEQRALARVRSGKSTLLHAAPRARDAALFVAAARAFELPVLVASPRARELFAQVSHSSAVEVVGFGSFCPQSTRAAAERRLARGGPLLVVVEPAQLFDDELLQSLRKVGLSLLGIAAAHACSEHAHELAPAYLGLREAVRALAVPVLGTCTLTSQRVVEQAAEAIGAGKAGVITCAEPSLERTARVLRSGERRAALLNAIRDWRAPGIVLTATVQEADAVFADLCAQGVVAVRAHAGMAAAERDAALVRFAQPGERLVLVSQSPHAAASGLAGCEESGSGLSSIPPRPDLRFVVHYQAPLSPEQHFEDLAWLPPGASSLVLADSSDAALVQALLAQQRIKPAAIEAVAAALSQSPADRPAFSDTLALRAGTSRRSTERVLSAFLQRNLIVRDDAQVARRVTPQVLETEARLLSARFAALRAADTSRAEAVARYVTSRHQVAGASTSASASAPASAPAPAPASAASSG